MIQFKRKILLVHTIPEQKELWVKVLIGGQNEVRVESPDVNIVELLKKWQEQKIPLPVLALIDIAAKTPDGNFLQVGSLCRWCKTNAINIKIVGLNPRLDSTKAIERIWADKLGLADIIPEISSDQQEQLIRRLDRILGVTSTPIDKSSTPIVNELQYVQPILTENSELPLTQHTPETPAVITTQAIPELADWLIPLDDNLLESLNQAIESNPLSDSAYCQRGEFYFESGDYAAALEDYQSALKLNPKSEQAYLNRASAFYKLGDHRAAMKDLEQVLKLNPKNALAYRLRGLAHFRAGDERGARKDYDLAIKLNPNFSQAYNDRATLRYVLGDVKGALQDYDQAIRCNPSYADAYYNRGNIYSDTGNFKAAVQDYTQAILYRPNFPPAYGNRGIAYYELNRIKEAIEDTTKAINLFDEQGDIEGHQQAIKTFKEMFP